MKKIIFLIYFIAIINQKVFSMQLNALNDELAIEEAAHLTLLIHSNPQKILLIGNGNILQEILKYSPENIVYIELDYSNNKTSKQYPLKKIKALNIDARTYVKTTNDYFDVILVNLNSSETIGSNRFYTIEFFNDVKRILNQGGI
ncbi:hypothetical protein HZA55_05370, partial [Candidatus Poribacteria bacterium]|nr:hypothetical protein [Candidatus Poribacteria bacterium]